MMDMLSQELVVTKLEIYGTSKHAVEKALNLYIFLFFSTVAGHRKFISLIPWDPEVLFVTWFQVIGFANQVRTYVLPLVGCIISR
jgi:hypothetical protein